MKHKSVRLRYQALIGGFISRYTYIKSSYLKITPQRKLAYNWTLKRQTKTGQKKIQFKFIDHFRWCNIWPSYSHIMINNPHFYSSIGKSELRLYSFLKLIKKYFHLNFLYSLAPFNWMILNYLLLATTFLYINFRIRMYTRNKCKACTKAFTENPEILN
mmetsp:Transcript_5612/g.4822  ORF Transcript_5612/g.4822 Transcript_5612/m.4822 type:complete len:159 (+) Transcript_5612:43-519(+)